MIHSIAEATERAKKFGISSSEFTEGYNRERAPILPYPFNDLNTDARDCENGCACRTYAGIEIGCLECREVVKNPSYCGTPRTVYLSCPECMEALVEWRS